MGEYPNTHSSPWKAWEAAGHWSLAPSSPAGAGTDSLVEAWDGQTPSEGSMKAHQSEAWGWPTDLCTKTGDTEPEWTG